MKGYETYDILRTCFITMFVTNIHENDHNKVILL